MAVEGAALLLEFVDHSPGVGVEQVDETLQDIKVEGWRNQFAVGAPFLSCNNEYGISKVIKNLFL